MRFESAGDTTWMASLSLVHLIQIPIPPTIVCLLISLIYSLAYTVLDCLPIWILSFNLEASASESRSTQYGKNIHYGEKVVIDGVGRQYRFHVV